MTVLGRPDAPPSMSRRTQRPLYTCRGPMLAIEQANRSSSRDVYNGADARARRHHHDGTSPWPVGYFINRAIAARARVAQAAVGFRRGRVARIPDAAHDDPAALGDARARRVSTDETAPAVLRHAAPRERAAAAAGRGLLNFGATGSGELQYRFEPVDPDAFVRDDRRRVSARGRGGSDIASSSAATAAFRPFAPTGRRWRASSGTCSTTR